MTKSKVFSLISIISVILLVTIVALAVVSCNSGGGSGDNTTTEIKPTLTKVKVVPFFNGHNGDEESPVCLEFDGNQLENFNLEISISNPDRNEILSFNYNGVTYDKTLFASESTPSLIIVNNIIPPVKSGDFEVKIDEIKYSNRKGVATVTGLTNNVKTVRIQPTFTLTLDFGGVDGESRVVKSVTNDFLSTLNVPLEEDMNEYETTSLDRLVYGIKGYVFDGWYTEKGGQGKKIEQFSKYSFYKDITLYAHYARPYKYSVSESDVTITGLTEEGKRTRFSIEIPEEIDGKPVRKIGYCAFTTIGQGKTFILPSTVTEIDDYAFANCVGVQVELASVEKIGVMAFSNCGEIILGGANRYSSSRVAELPNTLKEIGKSAFRGSYWYTRALSPYREAYFRPELPTVLIPSSVEKIGDYAFAESGFYAVYFHKDLSLQEGDLGVSIFEGAKNLNSIYTSYNFTESGSIISTSGTTGVKVIPQKTFYNCTSLVGSMAYANLKLNEGLEKIGELAFAASGEGMTNLEYISFPDSLKFIEKQAFANTGLQNVKFSSGSKLQTLGENCFQASKFEEITIYSLRTYGKAPFWGNTNLKAINILSPTLPTYTETDAWGSGLTRKAKYYVKKELLNAYRDKNSSWADGDTQDYICAYDYIVTSGNTTLSFEPIDESGAYDPTSTKVKVTSVFNTTREIRVPSKVTLGDVTYDVISVGKYFVHDEVTKVLLPDTLERIENRAFYACKVLYDVIWMSGNTELKKGKNGDISLKYIGGDAFNGTAITYFYSNKALTEIGKQAFHNCKNLYTVVLDLGDSLDVLGSAFSQSGLKTLVIGLGVERVYDSAFQGNVDLAFVLIRLTDLPKSNGDNYPGHATSPLAYCDNISAVYLFSDQAMINFTSSKTPNGQNNGWSGIKKKDGITSAYEKYVGEWSGALDYYL